MADKGSKRKANNSIPKSKTSKRRRMPQDDRNRPLTHWQMRDHKAIGKTRWRIEQTFGSLKWRFGAGVTRLKGKDKVHSNRDLRRLLLMAILLKIEKKPTKPSLKKRTLARKKN